MKNSASVLGLETSVWVGLHIWFFCPLEDTIGGVTIEKRLSKSENTQVFHRFLSDLDFKRLQFISQFQAQLYQGNIGDFEGGLQFLFLQLLILPPRVVVDKEYSGFAGLSLRKKIII